jgi:hypothetical protein
MNDSEDRIPLEPLDPGSSDPGFWVRFHSRVMDRARSELIRRQLATEPTVTEVVFAWRRALVPFALLAAALAGILLVSQEPARTAPVRPPLALEDVVLEELESDPISTFLSREVEVDDRAFLASLERF